MHGQDTQGRCREIILTYVAEEVSVYLEDACPDFRAWDRPAKGHLNLAWCCG